MKNDLIEPKVGNITMKTSFKSIPIILIILIWCANVSAQEAHQYLPRWSPDGEKYAFVEIKRLGRTMSSSIKIRSATTGDVLGETIADLSKIPIDPEEIIGLFFFDWAYDSKRYVFTSVRQQQYVLFISQEISGKEVIKLTQSQEALFTPRWSPDGKYIVFKRSNLLYLLHSESQFHNLEELKPEPIPLEGLEEAMLPEWSPDSKKIAFSGLSGDDFDIYIYDLNTEKIRRVTQTKEVQEYHPVWSPDGEWLAFYSKRKENREQFDIAIAKADQENLSQCQTEGRYYHVSDGTIQVATDVMQTTPLGPSWMPSSRHLVYVKHDEKKHHPIEVVEFDFQLSQNVRVSDPKSLDTNTQLNADVQCTRSGTPKLVFQRYSEVGELPLKTVNLYPLPMEPEILTVEAEPRETSTEKQEVAEGEAQEGDQYLPHWSPDGEKYAFVEMKRVGGTMSSSIKIRSASTSDGSDVKIAELPIADLSSIASDMLPEETRSLATGIYFFDWAPNSQGYVFTSMGEKNYDLFLSPSLEGKDVYPLTQSDKASITPRWSSKNGENGEDIVFARNNQLYLLHSESQFKNREELKPQKIPPEGFEKTVFPEWSPNGAKIAFSGLSGDDFDIYIYDLNTEKIRPVTQTKEVQEYHPVWSPDGKWLAFYSNRKGQGQFDIAIALADAENLSQCQQTNKPTYFTSRGTIQVATDVRPSAILGPSWMPSSQHIVYVKKDEKQHHPIEVVEFSVVRDSISEIQILHPIELTTNTQSNLDVQCVRKRESKLVFSRYSEADGLPSQTVKLYPMSMELKNLIFAVIADEGSPKIKSPIYINEHPLSGQPLKYPLGSLVEATVKAEGYKDEHVSVPIKNGDNHQTVRLSAPEVTLRVHVKDENNNYLKKSFNVKMKDVHLCTTSDGYKEAKIKVLIYPNESDYGLGPFSIDDKRYSIEPKISKDKDNDNAFDIILILTPEKLTLNIEVLQPDRKAPIEGTRVELKDILKTTNSYGIAQFTDIKVIPKPTIVIHPTDIYQGDEFELTYSHHGGLVSSTHYNVREENQIWYVTVKLQEKQKEVKVVPKDEDSNDLPTVHLDIQVNYEEGLLFSTPGSFPSNWTYLRSAFAENGISLPQDGSFDVLEPNKSWRIKESVYVCYQEKDQQWVYFYQKGKPVANALVQINDKENNTDEHGRVTFSELSVPKTDKLFITVSKGPMYKEVQEKDVKIDPNSPQPIVITLDPKQWIEIKTLAKGKPLPTTAVKVNDEFVGGTDQNGRLIIPINLSASPKEYSITAKHQDYTEPKTNKLTIQQNQKVYTCNIIFASH